VPCYTSHAPPPQKKRSIIYPVVNITGKFQRIIEGGRAIFQRPETLVPIFVLWFGTIAAAGLTFMVQVILARVLGAEQFGVFAAALATVTLLAPFAGFGIAGYWLNVYGREGWQARRWLPGSFHFLILSTSVVLSLVPIWAWLGPHDSLTRWLLVILAVHILGQTAVALTSAKYQLEGQHARLASWQFIPHLLRFMGIGALILLIGRSQIQAIHVAMVFAAVALALLSFGAYQMVQMARGWFALEGHGASTLIMDAPKGRPGVLDVMSASWPFGLAGIFYLIYFQCDIILVKYLVDETAAGIYNVAFVVMAAVYLFPSVVFQKFLLPKLHRLAHHDTDKLYQMYRFGNAIMLAAGLTAMVLLWLIVPILLPWLFGEEYRGAISLLMILAVAAPFKFLASSAGAILTTRDFVHVKVRIMGGAAVLNVIMNLLLIPQFGAAGAAVTTVFTEFMLSIIFYYKLMEYFAVDRTPPTLLGLK